MSERIRVHFYIREQVPGGYTYTSSDEVLVHIPPSVDDIVALRIPELNHGRVVERSWLYAARGSVAWPAHLAYQQDPMMLDVIVEPSTGLFRDEIYNPEDDE
jgi:hypothetical protein